MVQENGGEGDEHGGGGGWGKVCVLSRAKETLIVNLTSRQINLTSRQMSKFAKWHHVCSPFIQSIKY